MDTYDSGFAITSAPAPEPAPTPRPEAGRGKAAAVTVAILAGIFAALCILIGVGAGHLRAANESPVWRTLRAVVPGVEVVENFLHTGGVVSVEGSLGDAIIPTVPADKNFGFLAEFCVDQRGRMQVGAELYSGEDALGDLSVFFGEKGLSVNSASLLDGELAVPFAGVAERLEQSVFAPDSGSSYAMDAESFEALLEMARIYDTTLEAMTPDETDPDAVSLAEVDAVLNDILTRLKAVEGLEKDEERREVELLDRTVKAKVYTYRADEQYVLAVLNFLRTEWQNNDELERIIRAGLRSTVTAEGGTEADLDKAVDKAYANLSTRFHAAIRDVEKAYDGVALAITLEAAVKSNYLVAADLSFAISPAEGEDTAKAAETAPATDGTADAAEHPANGITATLRLTSDPSENPSFTLDLYTYADGKTTDRVTASRTDVEEVARNLSTWELASYEYSYDLPHVEERVAFVFEHRPSGAYSASLTRTSARGPFRESVLPSHRKETLTVTAEGKFYLDNRFLNLELDRLTVTNHEVEDGKTLTYAEDDLYLYLSIAATTLTAPPLSADAPDPLTMSEEELNTRLADFDERFVTFRRAVNEALGMEVFKPNYVPAFSGELAVTDSMTHYAADAQTGHVILITTAGETSQMTIYDPSGAAMKELYTVKLDRAVAAMDADGGRIVLSYKATDKIRQDGDIHVFSAEDGRRLDTFTVKRYYSSNLDYIDDLALDGEHLFYTTEDQSTSIVMVDVTNGRELRDLGRYYQPAFTLDRPTHRLFSAEHGVSSTSCGLFDTVTGARLATWGIRDYSYAVPYMTGSHILLGDVYLDMNCEEVNPVASVTESFVGRPVAVLRMDDLLHAYLTRTGEDKFMTELYTAAGQPMAVYDATCVSLTPCGEQRYIALISDGDSYRLCILQLEEKWLLFSDGE